MVTHFVTDISTYICNRAGLILGGAGIFVLLMPWMDRKREEWLEAEKALAIEAAKPSQENSNSITRKVEELRIKASSPVT